MKIRTGSAVRFLDPRGNAVIGIVTDFAPVDGTVMIDVSVRGRKYTITSDDLAPAKPVNHKPLVSLNDLIGPR